MRAATLLILVLVAVAGPTLAGPTPTQKCMSTKTKAAGKNGSANGVCAAKASQAGLPADGACLLTRADDKLAATYGKADLKGGCVSTGDAGAIAGILDGVVTFATDQLADDGSASSRKCATGRRKATGKYVSDTLKCHAKAAQLGTSVETECLDKAQDRLSDAFARAEAASGSNCDTAADSPATKVAMDAIVGDVLAALAQGGTTTTTTTSSTTTTTSGSPVSFASDVQPIFTANCTLCHSGEPPVQGLDLSAGVAYGNIVSVTSSECTPTKLVDPGSPSTSYLTHKLAGSGPCFVGAQMPALSPPLSASQQQTIADWIAQGAANN